MNSTSRRISILQQQLDPSSSTSRCDLGPAACSASVEGSPVFVGGLIMDIQATPDPDQALVTGGSVPGKVRQIPGGVSHNVAESLYKLLKAHGLATSNLPHLVSIVGTDSAGDALINHWKSFGMSTDAIFRTSAAATPSVSIIFDASGDVAASIADVAAVETELTPALIRIAEDKVKKAPFLMIDGDLCVASIEAACKLAAEHKTPVWFEPVSGPKATRATSVLHLLDYISPNKQELTSMAAAYRRAQSRRPPKLTEQRKRRAQASKNDVVIKGKEPGSQNVDTAEPSTSGIREVVGLHHDIAILLEAGVKNIVLTLGAQGAALCTLSSSKRHIDIYYLPPLATSIANCSGAGDCLVAGFLFAFLRGCEEPEQLAHGVAAAKCALETSRNVPESFRRTDFDTSVAQALEGVQYFQMPFFPLL